MQKHLHYCLIYWTGLPSCMVSTLPTVEWSSLFGSGSALAPFSVASACSLLIGNRNWPGGLVSRHGSWCRNWPGGCMPSSGRRRSASAHDHDTGSERLHGSPTRNSAWRLGSVRVACAHRARDPLGFPGNKGRKIEKGREA